jgi:3-hydroxybutyryl-CoA dehydrogenase
LISRIGIVGGGLMGSGIAQVVAQAGFEATIVDVDAEALARSLARIEGGYARLSAKGALSDADAAAALARIRRTTSLEEAADSADHVIETVVEDLEVKKDVLRRLGELCRDDVILATNTSQFSISALAAASGRPDRMIGSHWFNPAPVMRLIEIVRGVETSDETLAVALDLAERYGKETVVCRKDAPGFITSRLIALLMIEAARLVDEGIASVEDVNRACVLAFNHAQGPLDTADLSGLDTIERIGTALAAQYGERFLPPNALRSLVNAGHYGRKTGRGFSTYRDPS